MAVILVIYLDSENDLVLTIFYSQIVLPIYLSRERGMRSLLLLLKIHCILCASLVVTSFLDSI